jgi:hypothetical protein
MSLKPPLSIIKNSHKAYGQFNDCWFGVVDQTLRKTYNLGLKSWLLSTKATLASRAIWASAGVSGR